MPLPIKRENLPIKRPNLQAKQGLVLDGKTAYVQLPSHTMDSIEIECLIDGEQQSSAKLVDARTGLEQGWIDTSGMYGSDWLSVTGVKFNEKTLINAIAKQPFTDNVSLFIHNNGISMPTKGTLYKVTTYLNNQVQQVYDFTEPRTSDTAIYSGGEPMNLLPSFDSGEWNLHANARVLGRDVLELTSSTQSWLQNSFVLGFKPFTKFSFNMWGSGVSQIDELDENGQYIKVTKSWNSATKEFTTGSTTQYLKVWLLTPGQAGTFTFQRPTLIKVPTSQASINGNAQPQVKRAKRQLFSKR